MFGLAPSEILIIVIVALVCIGPSDLPRAMKTAAKWMSAGRKLAREFQGHVDELVREAELDELRDQAKKLTSQSLSSHLESVLDPDRELSKTFSPENLLPAFEPAKTEMPAMAEAAAAAPASTEPMLPGFVPASEAASAEPAPSIAEAEAAEEEQAVHPPMPAHVSHGN